jgi:hypothetical protein
MFEFLWLLLGTLADVWIAWSMWMDAKRAKVRHGLCWFAGRESRPTHTTDSSAIFSLGTVCRPIRYSRCSSTSHYDAVPVSPCRYLAY